MERAAFCFNLGVSQGEGEAVWLHCLPLRETGAGLRPPQMYSTAASSGLPLDGE
jgi:hypothetical protein